MTINFDKDKIGALPKDFTAALTGNGREGVWAILKDDASPDRKNVLARTDEDATSYRFPVCVYEKLSAKDVDLSVKFKPVSGKKDQAAGLVWRYRDKGNYYYEVEDGTFTEAGKIGVWTKADSVTYFDDLKVVAQ